MLPESLGQFQKLNVEEFKTALLDAQELFLTSVAIVHKEAMMLYSAAQMPAAGELTRLLIRDVVSPVWQQRI